ncbi:hypothetical protein LTR93_010842 [Exophiala xenobiotica]|nr:hypothetical protein LTR93_010842 [Exophiala xenobiotica]
MVALTNIRLNHRGMEAFFETLRPRNELVQMATIEAFALEWEAPSSPFHFSSAEGVAIQIDATPTTPTPTRSCARETRQLRKLNDDPYGPRSQHNAREVDEGTHSYIGVDSENTEHGRQTKFWGDRLAKEPQAQVQTETPTLAMAQVLQLVRSMVMSYETKVKDHPRAYEHKIEALLKTCQKDVNRIVALETQNQRKMELIKNSTNEQVKMTQSWAEVVVGAPPRQFLGHHTSVATVAPQTLR